MLLFLVRHALTAKTGELLTGWMPVELSEEGRAQARATADRLRVVKLDAIYSSPVQRALETAKAIALAQGTRVRVREGIGEVRYGEWEGRRLASIAKTKAWRRVMMRPGDTRFPGGETIRETQARALGTVAEIAAAHPKGSVALVSHADVIKLILAYYAGMPLDLYTRLHVDASSVSVLSVGTAFPRVLKLNETGALNDVGGRPIRVRARRGRR